MAELICRALRDGALEGELAPALTIKDSIASPFGFHVFSHVLAQLSDNILAGKSQSGGIILIAFSRSPSYYLDLLKSKGVDIASSNKWIRILDCYSDPLGWKDHLKEGGNSVNPSEEAPSIVSLCRNVRDLNRLSSLVIELGKGLVGQGKVRFGVAIDSVDELLRHSATTSVAGFLSNLRGHDQISSLFWLFHADLYEERVSAILEYMSSIVAGVEPLSGIGKRGNFENTVFEQNTRKGKFHVRFKRRNGRVRVMFEEYQVEQSGIKFTSIASEDAVVTQGFIPKVQFNLQLSEKERNDRANVVLPFEHQGNGKPIEIYDGRRSLGENLTDDINEESGKGEIIYFRDSDGEMPDSDEDPDDDLDI